MRFCLIFLLACSKKNAPPHGETDEVQFVDPVGIELSGENVMGAVAAEAGHAIPNEAVPELATALVAALKACPEVKTTANALVSVRLDVEGGALHAPDEKRDALNACVAKAMDGKPIKNIAPTKLLVQIAPKERK